MQAFTTICGPAAPLLLTNVDTDVIIRIDRLTAYARDALGPFALEPLRYLADGSDDPGFVLNQPRFRGAPILLAGANFGCGSSREAAVWALMAMGFRCVIAPSFGDIFYGNCFQNGMLPIKLDEPSIASLAAAAQTGASMKISLYTKELSIGDLPPISFQVDELRRQSLLEGLDAIGLTQKDAAVIAAWQDADRKRRPWAWNPVRRTEPPLIRG